MVATRKSKPLELHEQARRALHELGLSLPEAHTKSPWPGHLDLAVRDKTFAYINLDGEPLRVSCKLPQSCTVALMLHGVTPTGYGLGRSGWVSIAYEPDDRPEIDMLKSWLMESYRAQAPKKLVKVLDAQQVAATKPKPAKPRKSTV